MHFKCVHSVGQLKYFPTDKERWMTCLFTYIAVAAVGSGHDNRRADGLPFRLVMRIIGHVGKDGRQRWRQQAFHFAFVSARVGTIGFPPTEQERRNGIRNLLNTFENSFHFCFQGLVKQGISFIAKTVSTGCDRHTCRCEGEDKAKDEQGLHERWLTHFK